MNLFFNKTKIIKNINTSLITMIFALFELFVQNVLTTFGRMCFQVGDSTLRSKPTPSFTNWIEKGNPVIYLQ